MIRKFWYSVVFIFLASAGSNFGQQVIGSFPTMDGGFEGQKVGVLTQGSISAGNQTTAFTCEGNNGTGIQSSVSRTGSKSVNIYYSGTSTKRMLQSPTAGAGLITNVQYTVQYYYRTPGATGTGAMMQIGVSSSGTASPKYYPSASPFATLAATNGTWNKVASQVTVTAAGTASTYGIGIIRASASGNPMGIALDVDDFVVYAGTTDVTAPDPIQDLEITSAAATQQTLSWSAPTSGVDGGGYMVVRGVADPATTPNVNGIYAMGGTVAAGETVVYLGTNTTFTDNGLSPSTLYYYRVYTVDKAFNYSTAMSINGSTTAPGYAAEPTLQSSNITFANVALTQLDINWSAGDGSNHLVVVRAGSAVTGTPTDGGSYTASATFGSGTALGTDNYVVYNGTGTSVTLTGLTKATTYYVSIFDFNGSSGSENYLTTGAPSANQSTTFLTIYSNGTGGGNWGAAATWAGGSIPGSSDNVVIVSPDVVILDASGKTAYNMTIDAGAKLYMNTPLPTSSISYLNVYGPSFIVNGTFGDLSTTNPGNDAISLQFVNNLTISGTGVIKPARIRPLAGVSNVTLTLDADVTCNYNGSTGSGGAGFYSDNATNDNITLTVNAGRTLTMAEGSNLNTASSSASSGGASTTFNINGTLNMLGTTGNVALGIASGKTCNFNVNGTANIANELITSSSSGATPTVTVGASGVLTVKGKVDFQSSSAGVITGAGTFTLPAGATIYVGNTSGLEPVAGPIRTATRNFNTAANYGYYGTTGNQVTGDELPATVNNLVVANTNGITLTNNLTVNGTLQINTATLNPITLGTKTLTYGPAGILRFAGTSAQTSDDVEFPATNGPASLSVANAVGVNLHASRTIPGTLTLSTGKLFLGNNNLVLGTGATVSGTVSSTNFICQNGTGRLEKQFAAAGSFQFPLGDTTGNYIATTNVVGVPVTLTFNSGTFSSGVVSVTTTKAKHANNTSSTDYLNRYWTVTSSGITGFNADISATFAQIDLVGTQTSLFTGEFTGGVWKKYSAVNATPDDVLRAAGVTAFGDITGGEASAFTPGTMSITVIPEGYYSGSGVLRIQDTVKVYLANTTTLADVDSALLVVDSTSFTGTVSFSSAPSGTYYLYLKGRAFLQTWSGAGVAFTQGSTSSYDFTSAATQAYGSNMVLKGSKWCIHNGDVDQSGFIDNNDLLLIDNSAFSFTSGYVITDIDGSRYVDNNDLLICDNNAYNFTGTKTPAVGKMISRPVVQKTPKSTLIQSNE